MALMQVKTCKTRTLEGWSHMSRAMRFLTSVCHVNEKVASDYF